MNPSDSTTNTTNVPPTSPRSSTWVAISIICMQLIIALIAYPFLPPIVPSHWNAAGQIDGYMPKLFALALFPVMSTAIYVFIRFIIGLGPVLGRQSQRANLQIVNLILIGELLLFLVIELITIAAAFHIVLNILFILNIILSIFFIFIGNYLGKLRRNFWAGIRTPWTLANDTVWERTHRVGGWLFVGIGLLGLLMSFIPLLQVWGLIGLILLSAVFLVVYSYLVFHRLEASGANPLSRPFDEQG